MNIFNPHTFPLPELDLEPVAKAAWRMYSLGVSHPGHRAGKKRVENRFGGKQRTTSLGPTTTGEGGNGSPKMTDVQLC